MRIILALAAVFCAARSSSAAETPPGGPPSGRVRAAAILTSAFGPEGTKILHDRGYATLTQGGRSESRVVHVQWDMLLPLARHAKEWKDFLHIKTKNSDGIDLSFSLAPLRTLQGLPAGGLKSGPVRAAIDTLALGLSEGRAMGKAFETASRQPPLFSLPWASGFLERNHAEMMTDPRLLAGAYFNEVLSRSAHGSGAYEHFLLHASSVYGEDAGGLLEESLRQGTAGSKIRAWIANYLLDQRRLWTVTRMKHRLAELARSTTLSKDCEELGVLADALIAKPETPAEVRRALEDGEPDALISFSAPELHAHNLDHSGFLDVGDTVRISIAYWVSGLEPGAEASVAEAGFADLGTGGVADRTLRAVGRKNGGPYVFTADVPVRSGEPFLYRLVLDAESAPPMERSITVPARKAYTDLLLRVGEAEREAAACQLSAAADALEAIEAETAVDKAQFLGLLGHVRGKRKELAGLISTHEQLLAAIDGAKLYATGEQCEFRVDRAERALDLLKRLPPGCDAAPGDLIAPMKPGTAGLRPARVEDSASRSVELRGLFRAAARRRALQEEFRKAVDDARSLERSCAPEKAARTYALALALLESDPETRCGPWEEDFTAIRLNDLPRAAFAGSLAADFDDGINKASFLLKKEDYAGALRIVLPMLSAIDSLHDSACFAGAARKAEEIARAAGVGLGPASPKTAAAALPKESLASEISQVRGEWERSRRRRRSENARELLRQSPLAPGVEAAP